MKYRFAVLVPLLLAAGLAMPASATTTAYSRYRQIEHFYNAPAHGQGYGQARCPDGTRVVGGGVLAQLAGATQTVSSSYPANDGRSWLGRLNNNLDDDVSFRVMAVCLAGVRDYAIVRGRPAAAPPNADQPTVASARCPLNTVVLAGGGATDSASTRVVLAAELPTADAGSWRVYYNNRSWPTVPVAAYAICGHRPPGYTILTGRAETVAPHQTQTALAVCASGIVVLGSGGAPVGGPSVDLDLNSVFVEGAPVGEVYLNNRTGQPRDVTATSICADVG